MKIIDTNLFLPEMELTAIDRIRRFARLAERMGWRSGWAFRAGRTRRWSTTS